MRIEYDLFFFRLVFVSFVCGAILHQPLSELVRTYGSEYYERVYQIADLI